MKPPAGTCRPAASLPALNVIRKASLLVILAAFGVGASSSEHSPIQGAPLSRFRRLVREVHRRSMWQVLAIYLGGSYVVFEVVEALTDGLGLPRWMPAMALVLLLVGLPVVLATAFVQEGPAALESRDATLLAGIQTEEMILVPEHQPEARPAHRLFTWRNAVAGGLGAAALWGLVVTGWLLMGAEPTKRADGVSVAVLPFDNIASSEETQPFVEGIHDDLVTQLAKIDALRVISRSSVLEYAATTRSLTEIADELGVDHIIEGGVQRAGDHIRINVQLIDGRTDEHIWAETYNRDLTAANIFAVQTEIAEAIAGALRARLTADDRADLARRPTESLEAYDHYLRGMAYFRRSLVEEDVRSAAEAFEGAVDVDPAFADAWARLAIARATLSWEFAAWEERARAQEAAARAANLEPASRLVLLAQGYVHYYGYREYNEALEDFRRALDIAPDDPEILQPIGWVLRRQGRGEEALEYFHRAFERDPRHFELAWASLGITNMFLRNYDEAERFFELAHSIDPARQRTLAGLARLELLRSGDTDAAVRLFEQRAVNDPPARYASTSVVSARFFASRMGDDILALDCCLAARLEVAWRRGDSARARLLLDSARVILEAQGAAGMASREVWGYQGRPTIDLGYVHAMLGNREEAIRYGRRGVAALQSVGDAWEEAPGRAGLADIYLVVGEYDLALDELEWLLENPSPVSGPLVLADPLWRPLRDHPRFLALVTNEE